MKDYYYDLIEFVSLTDEQKKQLEKYHNLDLIIKVDEYGRVFAHDIYIFDLNQEQIDELKFEML